MKILIVSDTHRQNNNYLKAVKQEQPFDMMIHCGDAEGSEFLISEAAACPVHMVLGNNDFFSDLPRELEFMIGSYKIWVTHGHFYFVSMDNKTIKKEAKARGADIVIFGHTHKPIVEEVNGIIAINPGSLTYPRQEGKKPSYVIMELEDGKKPVFTIKFLG